mgnify:CR=1 FL=1
MAGEEGGLWEAMSCFFFIILIGVLIWFLYKRAQQKNAMLQMIWTNSANQLGIVMDQTNKRQRSMYGAVNGVTYKIYTHTKF